MANKEARKAAEREAKLIEEGLFFFVLLCSA